MIKATYNATTLFADDLEVRCLVRAPELDLSELGIRFLEDSHGGVQSGKTIIAARGRVGRGRANAVRGEHMNEPTMRW
jgi:hypothetical protein